MRKAAPAAAREATEHPFYTPHFPAQGDRYLSKNRPLLKKSANAFLCLFLFRRSCNIIST